MSEEQMNDSTFSRLFIVMIISISVLSAVLMVLASVASSDVNARLDLQNEAENSDAIASRIKPVGQFSAESAVVAEAVPVETVTLSGEQAYASCAACHAQGIAGAPQVGSSEAWTARIKQGIDILYDRAINGYTGATGFMPAKGGNIALSDDSVKAAVDYMVDQSK